MRFLFLIALFTFELYSMDIEFSRHFQKTLKPNLLGVNITIAAKKKSEKDVLDILNRYSNYINGFKELDVKGGSYTINPNLRYENSHSYKDGYIGVSNFNISSKNSNDIGSFVYKLQSYKRDKGVDISVSNIYWFVDNNLSKSIYDDLRLEAIEWGIKYIKTLSSKIEKSCELKSVVFNQNSYPAPILRNSRSIALDVAPTPKKDIKNYTIYPRYKVICK